MKKIISLMLSLAMVLVLFVGCDSSPNSTAKTKKIKIGIAQSIEHTSLNQIKDAIIQELINLGYDQEHAEIDYQNAQGDSATLNSICSKFEGDQKDIVIAIGTTTSNAVCGSIKSIPIVFSSVTDPVGAGLVQAFDQTDNNITGIANAFALDDIFALSKQLTPNIKSIGFLHCSSEHGAAKIIDDAKKELTANYKDISYKEVTISSANELQQAVESMVGKVDAIFVPNDSVVAASMGTVTQITRANNIPVYVTADSLVWDGGLATVGINYEELGKMTAGMVDEILKGKPVSEANVKAIDVFRTVINQTTADEIGVVIPDSIKATADICTDKKN